MAFSNVLYLSCIVLAAVIVSQAQDISSPVPAVYAASIGVKPQNVSSFYGGNASFYCSVSGEQGQFETFQWRRITPGPPTILTNNDISRNTSKYLVTEKYRLTILDVKEEDDGEYACALNLESFSAHLVCIAAPENVEMYWTSSHWTGRRTYAEKDREINLNCDVEASRPRPEIKWYKGAIEMTSQATDQEPKLNATGYAHMTSVLPLNLTQADDGALFKCTVHLPGSPDIANREMRVTFSSARMASAGLLTVLSIVASLYLQITN